MSAPASAPCVFVSHCDADNAYCREYVAGLRNAGLDVWYDEHGQGRASLHKEIGHEIEACTCFIVILSPTSVDSVWVQRDVGAALALEREGHLKTLLAVVAVQCRIPSLLQGYPMLQRPGGE